MIRKRKIIINIFFYGTLSIYSIIRSITHLEYNYLVSSLLIIITGLLIILLKVTPTILFLDDKKYIGYGAILISIGVFGFILNQIGVFPLF